MSPSYSCCLIYESQVCFPTRTVGNPCNPISGEPYSSPKKTQRFGMLQTLYNFSNMCIKYNLHILLVLFTVISQYILYYNIVYFAIVYIYIHEYAYICLDIYVPIQCTSICVRTHTYIWICLLSSGIFGISIIDRLGSRHS